MRRLLWKELREKWLWLLLLVASTSGLILCHDAYFFLGKSWSGWGLLSVLAALGLGTSAYSTELAGGAADFIRSRPVSWKKMLLAKVILGFAFLIFTALLATLVFRVTCPPQYLRFADLSHLLTGFGIAMAFLGCAYIAGFVCSVVLPGPLGGMLLVAAIPTSYFLWQYCLQQAHAQPRAYWSGYLIVIGALVASVLISRFGLTLPTARKVTRYLSVIAVFVLIGLPLDYCVKSDPLFSGTYTYWNISEDGKYAALEQQHHGLNNRDYVRHSYFVRLSDGTKAPTVWPDDSLAPSYWHRGTLAVVYGKDGVQGAESDRVENHNTLWMGRMDASGRLHHIMYPLNRYGEFNFAIVPSPSGRLIMVAAAMDKDWNQRLTFAVMDSMRPIGGVVEGAVRDYWWQSETEVGYTDRKGKRHFLRVED